MDERLKKQFDFIKEIDKEKIHTASDIAYRRRAQGKRCRARMAYGAYDRAFE